MVGAGWPVLASQIKNLTLYAASPPAWGNLKRGGGKGSEVVPSEFCEILPVAVSSYFFS